MKDMKSYFSNVDDDKLEFVQKVKSDYELGKITLEEGRERLKNKIEKLEPYEIALIEQSIKEFDLDECVKEDIQQVLDLFEGLLNVEKPKLEENHPISRYYQENDKIREVIVQMKELLKSDFIKNKWLEIYDKLAEIKKHFSRKQNQLYSVLEQKGFDRPTTTMWVLDDFVRDEIRDARELLHSNKVEEFLSVQNTIIEDLLDLFGKEENILYPTSISMISDEEFEDMKIGDAEIGYALLKVENKKQAENSNFAEDLQNLLSKYGYSKDTVLDVKTGELTLDQINLIFTHMPVDISFVDENEIVKFYTDTPHRVFPRSKNVIGREVKNCHPRKSLDKVEEIINKFRTGEQDEAEFWINKPDLFIYIKFIAVRDEAGVFKGVMEVMQDCTRIRSLTGSKTLLTWDKKTEGDKEDFVEHSESEQSYPKTIEEDSSFFESESGNKEISLNEETRLQDLINSYPWLKDKLQTLNPAFKMLKTSLARIMIPKSNIRIMSERSGMDLEELIEGIKRLIKENN